MLKEIKEIEKNLDEEKSIKIDLLQEIKTLINDSLEEVKIDFDKDLDKIDQGWIEALEFSLFVIHDTERRYTEQGKL